MVPPIDTLGPVPLWVGVYLALLLSQAVAGYLLYRRFIRLIRQGKPVARFDHPWQRLAGATAIVLGQRKVLQRVGASNPPAKARDLAGVAHVIIFWGFLSFALSYLIFIFGNSVWPPFAQTLLTGTGVRVYATYLDLLAAALLAVLVWALVRRWVARPHRLSFDLTRNLDAVVVVGLIMALMVTTLVVHGLYVAQSGEGPEAQVIIGGLLGDWFLKLGLDPAAAHTLHAGFWWLHLGIILGFAI
ncbi:MAG TPA: hypothetical protein VI855_05700, partial [Dehalococcoidia bacterium]|nr:hypothetical protein [Dehalococcoidia bacterium]